MTDLIDTTEMYLRTILDLEEEHIVPLRARISVVSMRSVNLKSSPSAGPTPAYRPRERGPPVARLDACRAS